MNNLIDIEIIKRNSRSINVKLTELKLQKSISDNPKFVQKEKNRSIPIIKAKEIYKQIKDDNKVEFTECAMEDFSVKELQQSYESSAKKQFNLSKLTMKRCIFVLSKSNDNFEHDLSNCTIQNIDFSGSIFLDGFTNFQKSTFESSKICFTKVVFEYPILFDYTIFKNCDVSFSSAKFNNGKNTFVKTQFIKSSVSFEHSIINNGYHQFNVSKFVQSEILFNNADYDKSIIEFFDCNIDEDTSLSFYRSKLGSLIFNNLTIKNVINLDFDSCSKLIIKSSLILGSVKFPQSHTLDGLLIRNLDVVGQIIVNWDAKYLNHLIYDNDSLIDSKLHPFLIFKEAYRKLGYYDREDAAYIEYKRCERKNQKRLFLNSINTKFKYLLRFPYYVLYFFKWLLFDVIGEFATNPKRVLFSYFIIFLIFGAIYTVFPSLMYSKCDIEKNGFYYSIITMLTIGYGDIRPDGLLAQILSGLQGFLGLFLMAYFTIAFSRKILR